MSSGHALVAVHTLDEAAAILRVKPSWLERQAAARKIPFTMLGGGYRFTAEHLVTIITLHENRAAPASHHAPEHTTPRHREPAPRASDLQSRPLRPRPRRAASLV